MAQTTPRRIEPKKRARGEKRMPGDDGPPPKQRGKRSNAPHKPTRKMRDKVKFGGVLGVPHDLLAETLGMTVDTMYKYYRHELDNGIVELGIEALSNLKSLGKVKDTPNYYYLQNRFSRHWRDTRFVEVKDTTVRPDLSNLSGEDLRTLREAARIMKRATMDPKLIEHEAQPEPEEDEDDEH